jgi:acetolactate synthase-1/2/3 large subunit
MYTASTALLEALFEWGVTHVFANFGSDHPALIEAIAEARALGRPVPAIVTSPHEMVALSCAHGHAQVSGRAQAVIVHVECGTQSLGGAVHNASRGHAPVLVFAGMSPFTQEGETKGSRNEFIQWIQDVSDQRGIVRGYMKYDNELRSAKNVKQIVYRAMQFAHSDPRGPVYLVGAREIMEEPTDRVTLDRNGWNPIASNPLPDNGVAEIVAALAGAERPLIVTSNAGRNPVAFGAMHRFANALGIGVIESVPMAANFPHTDPLYQGNYWNNQSQNPVLAAADAILVVDSDVPWIPTVNRPAPDATVYHIDIDPLKQSMPLWHIEARRSFRADAATALTQLADFVGTHPPDAAAVKKRAAHYAGLHARRAAMLAKDAEPEGDIISGAALTAAVRRQIDLNDTIVLTEGITNYSAIADHIAPDVAGSYFGSGGGSLGWNGGAAVGAKLAAPEKTVVALCGDGSYMFSVPSTVHWMARQYKTPFLQVVYNNRGWAAPKFSALAVNPDGYTRRANDLDLAFDPPPDYGGIAATAGGAFTRKVEKASELESAIAEALRVVREEKRAAVLDVWLPRL